MPFNIEQFRAFNNDTGVSRYYNYTMRLTMPEGLLNNEFADQYRAIERDLEFTVDGINFPQTGVQLYPVRRYGYGVVEQKPVFPIFNQLQCSFILDEEVGLQRFFHDWMRIITNYDFDYVGINGSSVTTAQNTPIFTYEVGYKTDYITHMNLLIFNSEGFLVRDIIFREAYPVVVSDINYGWSRQNDYVKLPVMFTFMDWFDNRIGGEK